MTKLCAAWLGCVLILVVLAVAGCTSADKCSRGEAGCACTSDDGCDKGASCIEGTCVAKGGKAGSDSGAGGDASGGGGSGGGDASTQTDGGNTHDAGGAIDCEATTFEDACREYCRALCASEANLCLDSQCEDGFCGTDGGQLRDTCDTVCANDDNHDDDVSCMQDLCKGELKRTCEEFGYEDNGEYVSGCFNEDPACVPNPDFGCSNVCGTMRGGVGAQLKMNNKCEDGGEGSVADSPCARGTDCIDCGKRTCAQQGEHCNGPGDCCGFYPNMGAYCVDTDGDLSTTDDAQCLVDCTSGTCPGDAQCQALSEDAGSVCVPPPK